MLGITVEPTLLFRACNAGGWASRDFAVNSKQVGFPVTVTTSTQLVAGAGNAPADIGVMNPDWPLGLPAISMNYQLTSGRVARLERGCHFFFITLFQQFTQRVINLAAVSDEPGHTAVSCAHPPQHNVYTSTKGISFAGDHI